MKWILGNCGKIWGARVDSQRINCISQFCGLVSKWFDVDASRRQDIWCKQERGRESEKDKGWGLRRSERTKGENAYVNKVKERKRNVSKGYERNYTR